MVIEAQTKRKGGNNLDEDGTMRSPRRNWKEFWSNARKNWRLETFPTELMGNGRFFTVKKFEDHFFVETNKDKELRHAS